MGSKNRYSRYIVPILQNYIDKNNIKLFIDGCCGGANIVDKVKCEQRIAIDLNENLIELFKYLQQGGQIPEPFTKEKYLSCKDHPEENQKWEVAIAQYFCTYSARGFSGGFCLGDPNRNYYEERKNNILKQLPNLLDIDFKCQDINDLEVSNALIYIDPPYEGTKQYDIIKKFDYDKFWNTVRRLSENNIVLVSSEHAPEDFESIWHLDVKRCLGATKGQKSSIVTENLFILKNML